MTRIPRTRGDGPAFIRQDGGWKVDSPHTRGWTLEHEPDQLPDRGFPAHAGMDPGCISTGRFSIGIPRTRGDGPGRHAVGSGCTPDSPHTRGWTQTRTAGRSKEQGFPAHAGMDPAPAPSRRPGRGIPRTRGDGPGCRTIGRPAPRDSPHTRGWTLIMKGIFNPNRGFPAHAGMDPWSGRRGRRCLWIPRTRGDGPCPGPFHPARCTDSPHTRGWTPAAHVGQVGGRGFPAHAGMDLGRSRPQRRRSRIPRTRGDGPISARAVINLGRDSPHTRGWTRLGGGVHRVDQGFPAHAGMDPRRRQHETDHARIPRTRGDGPIRLFSVDEISWDSPHTRGWTHRGTARRRRHRGFPAHAGMDPEPSCLLLPPGRIPRTRGDGPAACGALREALGDSPHTRGWTLDVGMRLRHGDGFPAHAGMDPRPWVGVPPPPGIPRTRGDGPSALSISALLWADSPHTRGWTPCLP